MGIAAYNRGTLVIQRQADADISDAVSRTDLSEFRQMARDADTLADGIREMSDSFHYFYACGWWREARIARARGISYRTRRNAILSRLRSHGFQTTH